MIICELHKGSMTVADHQAEDYCYVCQLKAAVRKYQKLFRALVEKSEKAPPVNVLTGYTACEWVSTTIKEELSESELACSWACIWEDDW